MHPAFSLRQRRYGHQPRVVKLPYSAAVTYEYRVVGEKYTGNKIAFGAMSSSASYAHGVLDRYPVGKQVVVHYSPEHPAEAVLETGIHGGTWMRRSVYRS